MSLNKFCDIANKKTWMNINCDKIECNSLSLSSSSVATYQFSNTETLPISINGAGTYTVIDFSGDTPTNNVDLIMRNGCQYTFECLFLKGAGTVVLASPLLFKCYIGGFQSSNIGGIMSIIASTLVSFKMKIACVSGAGTPYGVIKTVSEIVYVNNLGVRTELISYALNNIDLLVSSVLNFTLETADPSVYSLSRVLSSIKCDFQAVDVIV
jgi:hypothetical protein